MRRIVGIAVSVNVAILPAMQPLAPSATSAVESRQTDARLLIGQLAKRDFGAAAQRFDARMQAVH